MPGLHGQVDRLPASQVRGMARTAIDLALQSADSAEAFPACLHNTIVDSISTIEHAQDMLIFVSEICHMYFNKPAILSMTLDAMRENNKLAEGYATLGLTPALLERIWAELILDELFTAYGTGKPTAKQNPRHN